MQEGGGLQDIYVYKRSREAQIGRGLGRGLLGTLFRFIKPFLINSGKALGSEVLRSGTEILQGIGQRPIKDLLRDEAQKSSKNLESKLLSSMKGEGVYKRRSATKNESIQRQTAKRLVRRIGGRKNKVETKKKSVAKKTKKGRGEEETLSEAAFLRKYLK